MSETFFGITVFDVRGNPAIEQAQMVDVTRPNVDGIAFGSLGIRGREASVFLVSMHSGTAAVAAYESLLATKVGTINSFTMVGGLTYFNYILKSAIRTRLIRATSFGGGGTPDANSLFTVHYTCVVQFKS